MSELKSQDIFDIGYLVLVAALGGLDLLNHDTLDLGKTQAQDGNVIDHTAHNEGSNQNSILTLNALLSDDRFSFHFRGFIESCLKFDYK